MLRWVWSLLGLGLAGVLSAQPGEGSDQEALEAITLPADAAPPLERRRPKRVLENIVVTAQKVEQSLEDVPASVSTVDGDFIREAGLVGFPDLENFSANTDIRVHAFGAQLRIRGFGTSSSNRGFEPSVATIVDGVYYGRSQFLNAFFYDLERVEVLRGPQGTLFGKNSSAGVLNVVTVRPGLEPGGNMDVTIGDGGERALRPGFDLPLGENLRFRLSGSLTDSDGLLHNTFLDRPEFNASQETGKLRMLWTPGLNWEVDASAFASRVRMNNAIFQLSRVTDEMRAVLLDYDPEAEASAFNFLNSANVPTRADVALHGAQATVAFTPTAFAGLDQPTITSITAWAEMNQRRRDIDADFSAIPFIRDSLIEPSPFRQFSQELQFSASGEDFFGHGHGFNFVVGAHYFDSSLYATDEFILEDLGAAGAFFTAANIGSIPLPVPAPLLQAGITGFRSIAELLEITGAGVGDSERAEVRLDQRNRSGAVFGQVEYFWTPHWGVIAGLRWGSEEKQGDFSSDTDGIFIQAISEVEPHETHIDRSESEFSPRLGFKYRRDEDLTAYATWAQGYKSGGFNALPLNDRNLEFGPERASSFELGTNAKLLGGAMRLSAAAYLTEFENLQVNTFEGGNFIILNAAEAESRGFEMDLQVLPPLPGVDIRASVGLADAVYTRYPNAPQRADAPTGLFNNFLLASLPICQTVPTGPADEASPSPLCTAPTQDLAGRPVSGSPRWNATVTPSFSTAFLDGALIATLSFDVAYRGRRFLDVDLDPESLQPATTEYNARLIFGDPDGRWHDSFSGRNLSNEHVLDEVLDQPLAPGNYAAIRRDRGRFLSAQLGWQF